MKKILLIILLIMTPTACQKKEARVEKTLRINFQEGDLPSLHPHDLVIYLRGLSLAKVLYEPLTRLGATGEIEMAGAKSVYLSSDQLTYTFILRDNLWSDGSAVTAFQYESAWKMALSPTSTCSRADLFYCIKNGESAKKGKVGLDKVGVHALDAKTLVVDLEYPSPHFLELVSQAIACPLASDNKEIEIFNGPFVVSEWKKGNSLHLKPNPYYWDHKHVELHGIDISFVEDAHTVYSLYEKGDLDWVGVPLCPLSSETIQHLAEEEAIQSKAIGRSFWVFLNTKHPALTSATIRNALSLAIDREAVTQHVLVGAEPSTKALACELLPGTTTTSLKENLDEAKHLFEQGLEEMGLTYDTFPLLEISYSQQANRKQLAEYLQERWHTVFGIDVRLKAEEWNVLRSNLEKGLFTVSMAYEGSFYNDPLELLERYASDNPGNFSQWEEPHFGEKIQLAKAEKDEDIRMKLLEEAEEILMKQMPFIPICSDRLFFAHCPELDGYVLDSLGAIDFSTASLE